jgi:16S rRNA (uracil1498-N3)-methyltransferase
MSLPFFYEPELLCTSTTCVLAEETSKHVVQVLRMQVNEQVVLCNGSGLLATAVITNAHKKNCMVQIIATEQHPAPEISFTLGVSLLKNGARIEWLFEKATEIGVTAFVPLICKRTEKQYFKQDRIMGILISAMIQSRQTWLPKLYPPTSFEAAIKLPAQQKLIAHCMEGEKVSITTLPPSSGTFVLIGPEGDFTPDELAMALQQQFTPIALGKNRLRTETAALVTSALLANR